MRSPPLASGTITCSSRSDGEGVAAEEGLAQRGAEIEASHAIGCFLEASGAVLGPTAHNTSGPEVLVDVLGAPGSIGFRSSRRCAS